MSSRETSTHSSASSDNSTPKNSAEPVSSSSSSCRGENCRGVSGCRCVCCGCFGVCACRCGSASYVLGVDNGDAATGSLGDVSLFFVRSNKVSPSPLECKLGGRLIVGSSPASMPFFFLSFPLCP